MDINNAGERILFDTSDANKQTAINNANELTNINNNIVNKQMDISNISEHMSTDRHADKITHKVRIYFRSNAIGLDFDVTNELQFF